jgi:energy-coupling factor transporter ATP-binding protein EcfA2
MTGATFVRADLHVHTHADSDASPNPDFARYIDAAIDSGISVLAITDHNRTDFVRPAFEAATEKPIMVLPGVEISTHDGHLLALFDPDHTDQLMELCSPGNLKLKTLSDTEKRSSRSMLDLVQEIYAAGGLAIPAHIDAPKGAGDKLSAAQWIELLGSPALAGLEFATSEALNHWFTDSDPDHGRLEAWNSRQTDPVLKDRGLARLMSSDAHSPDKVGRDRQSRTLTRLRLDDANFNSIRNAIALNPKARCKAEVILPATYPHIVSAEFEGGFLDGVKLDFSANLNCLIGGRGSGKSTALLSIRAALGATVADDDDLDDADRMPSTTTVRFVDSTGSERTAIRHIGEDPQDPSGAPIRLRLADLGQEETGRLARGYNDEPDVLLGFLDGFLVRHKYDERERELLAQLEENGADVRRTSGIAKQIAEKVSEESRLDASLKAATEGRVEDIAKWATVLASQGPMLEELSQRIDSATAVQEDDMELSLDAIATEFGVQLDAKHAAKHAEGDAGLRAAINKFEKRRAAVITKATAELEKAAVDVRKLLVDWNAEHDDLEKRLQKKQAELEAQGLKVQAGAVRTIADRLNEVRRTLTNLRKRQDEHLEARKLRKKLLQDLQQNRENLFQERKAVLKRIATEANSYADDLTIRVSFQQQGSNGEWIAWLSERFGFRRPRVSRLAKLVTPADFADLVISAAGRKKLLALLDNAKTPFFNEDQLEHHGLSWSDIFDLQTMRLADRARIEVQRPGESERHQFDHLSAGQQRSVLLGLLLCAERSDPLVLDQPEDHLDGQYIASSVVRHLEAAKERRQVIIATHSANLTVLGDAELVIPMVVDDGKGRPDEPGAVDRPATRDQVCALLEGGVVAYKKRGERYGLMFTD